MSVEKEGKRDVLLFVNLTVCPGLNLDLVKRLENNNVK